MAAQVVKRLPEGDEWTYELKFDGYRALIRKGHDRVEIRSRKNKDLTRMYPRVAAAGLKLNADQAVVAAKSSRWTCRVDHRSRRSSIEVPIQVIRSSSTPSMYCT